MEREKSRTICHIKGQNFLADNKITYTILNNQYVSPILFGRVITNILRTCQPSSQQSSDAQTIKKFLRYKEKRLTLCVNKSGFYFLLELKTVCQVIPRVSCLSDVLTTKKTLLVVKTIVKCRNPGEEVETEVTNSETLNLQIFFSQAFVW